MSKVRTSYHDLQDVACSGQPDHISVLCLISICSCSDGPRGLMCLEPSRADASLPSAPHGWILSVSRVSVFTSTFLEEPSLPPRVKRVPILLLLLFFFFLAAPDLHCCVRALCSCGKWEPFSSCGAGASHCGGLSSCGAWALGCWASCPMACEIFPDQGLNWCPPALAGGLLTSGPPGKSPHYSLHRISAVFSIALWYVVIAYSSFVHS